MSTSSVMRPWEDEQWLERVRAFARGHGMEGARELVQRALTHRSLAEESPLGDNERLEFLGDSVLALLVNEYLYRQFPEHAEGQLTKLKASYVNERSLQIAAEALGLGPLIAMAPADEAAGGRERASTLSDAFEAVLAAVYLGRGLEAAREFVTRELIERVDPNVLWDHKSRLQEFFQEKDGRTPHYQTGLAGGPPHDPLFASEVFAGEELLGQGTGRSKKLAEQAAAADAMERLQKAEKKRRIRKKQPSKAQ